MKNWHGTTFPSGVSYYRKVKVGGQFTEAEKDAIIAIGKRLAKKGAW